METSGKVNLLPEELPSTRWETGVVKTRTVCDVVAFAVSHALLESFPISSLSPLGLTRLSSHGTNTWSAQSQPSLVDKRQRTRKLRGMLNPVSGSV